MACAHMCVNFEESEYVKSNLDCTDTNKVKSKSMHRSSKTVEPSKPMEREILYECCILMFNNEVPNRKCLVVDGYTIIHLINFVISRLTSIL